MCDTRLRVLDVGQCDLDHTNITRMLKENFEVAVDRAKSAEQAEYMMGFYDYDLVLVNRLFDTDGSEGLAFIAALKDSPETRDVPAMLVSNHADAQASAEALGALPGFGKDHLGSGPTLDKLRAALPD